MAMATTTHALMPANEPGLLLRLSPREQETIVEALKQRLEAIDKERDAVAQALAAVRLSRVG